MTLLTLRSIFPIFPDGIPGFGLLLLRTAAGVPLIPFGIIQLVDWQKASVMSLILTTLSLVCGLLLLFGLFNWFASSVSALIGMGVALALIPVQAVNVSSARLPAAFTAVIAIALLCLGPGAYSIDARRRGHRELIIPARSRSSDDSPG